ncbi:MAG: sugar ABC transporter permease [Clostridiales bacterium]|nr:sugar ABC transporter permease [Clostridiales bacterium]
MGKKIVRSGVLYVAPAFAIVALVMLYPLLYTLVMGFFENTLFMKAPEFCGVEQYAALFRDKVFTGSIVHTLEWTVGSVVCQFALGFAMALVLHQSFVRGKTVLRILLMVPWVLPSIIGSAVWKWMYNADYGLINYVLSSLGLIDGYQTWLSSPDRAMLSVIAVNVWKMFPYVMLMIEASLQGVSKDLKEAALIDGAGKLDIFRNVTWPAIAPQCYSVLLLLTVWTLNAFTFVYNLTEGGPAHATEVMAMFIYRKAFTDFDFGMASAASTVLFLICMAVSMVYIRMTREEETA